MNELLNKIRSRGYWQVIVRPKNFQPRKIKDISALQPILHKTFVESRGRDFPGLDSRVPFKRDLDWIAQEIEWDLRLSYLRFFQSGQLFYTVSNPYDWRDQSTFWPADQNWQPNKIFGVGDAIHTVTDIFEFASRLALSEAGDNEMVVQIEVGNLAGRILYMDEPRKVPFFRDYVASIESFPYEVDVRQEELIANAKEMAVTAVIELFKRFGFDTNSNVISEWQSKYLSK